MGIIEDNLQNRVSIFVMRNMNDIMFSVSYASNQQTYVAQIENKHRGHRLQDKDVDD